MPGEAEVDATLVLDSSPIAVTLGIDGTIGIGIETLQDHQTEDVRHPQTGSIDGSQMTLPVCGSLSAEGHFGRGIAIVEAQIQEVSALGIVLTIERRSVGLQRSVEVGVEGVHTQMETVGIIAQTTSCLERMEVMFLVHLRLCAMVVCIKDGRHRSVLVQRGISRAIGREGCQFEMPPHIDGCSSAKEGTRRTGGMSPEGIGGSSQVLQHRHFTQAETVVHHQSHPHRYAVVAQDEGFQATEVPQLEIKGIIVVAPFVPMGEEGLSGILRADEAQFDLIAVCELIAQPMAILRSQITVRVALSTIKRYARISHQFVLSVFRNVLECRQRGRLLLAHIDEKSEQASLGIVEFPDHRQFTE